MSNEEPTTNMQYKETLCKSLSLKLIECPECKACKSLSDKLDQIQLYMNNISDKLVVNSDKIKKLEPNYAILD
jgi:hypothetical protein